MSGDYVGCATCENGYITRSTKRNVIIHFERVVRNQDTIVTVLIIRQAVIAKQVAEDKETTAKLLYGIQYSPKQ